MTADSAIDRIGPTLRPVERAVGRQSWRDLLFVHWRVPATVLQPLVPAGLTIDTFDGSGWVGLIPFTIPRIRPWWFPVVPGFSWFHETNLRTYVHFDGRDPGVWFFSLDASSSLAVRGARWLFRLPYFRAAMQVDKDGGRLRYASDRRWPEPREARCRAEAEIGGDGDAGPPHGKAAPGTLEHFLIERYILYAQQPGEPLYQARVHHPAYSLQSAHVLHLEESLTQAAGLPPRVPVEHVVYCPGVDVEIFALKRMPCPPAVG